MWAPWPLAPATSALAAADALLYATADSVLYFEVVENRLRRRKLPGTDLARARQRTMYPASCQMYDAVTGDTPTLHGLALRPRGLPCVRDVLDMAPWVVW